jgi:hypothetical protein
MDAAEPRSELLPASIVIVSTTLSVRQTVALDLQQTDVLRKLSVFFKGATIFFQDRTFTTFGVGRVRNDGPLQTGRWQS